MKREENYDKILKRYLIEFITINFNCSTEFASESCSGVRILGTHAQELSLSFSRVFSEYLPSGGGTRFLLDEY